MKRSDSSKRSMNHVFYPNARPLTRSDGPGPTMANDPVPLARRSWHRTIQSGTGAMNRFERRPIDAGEAKIEFVDGEYRIIRPGAFVRCAVTGEPIPLEELRYWSVDRQEAYSSPAASMKRECERCF